MWYQARALLSPMSLATKMSVSKLIHYFPRDPAAFGFRSSTPPDNINLTSSKRKAYHSFFSKFQNGIGVAAHATPDRKQLISHLRVALLILFPLPHSEGGVIPVQKYVNYLPRVMTFWTMLCLNGLVAQVTF